MNVLLRRDIIQKRTVVLMLLLTIVLKMDLPIYQSVYIPTLTYGHELWVATVKVRLQTQVAKISIFRRQWWF